MAGVTFTRVTKRYNDTVAVDHFDLAVRDGEFLVLLGPSGCGKSTVLRLLAGLDEPTSGSIDIGGRPMARVDPKDRDIAMVFQNYALYPHMTVSENVEFPLLPRRVKKAERQRRVNEAASLLGLGELLDRKPAQLSGGQRQRVALARAIVRQPQVFLMDEPLSNLDAKMRAETRTELVELHRRLGATFVYVTHDQVEAMTMADRIAVMSQARLEQVGTAQEIYEQPATSFVARFVGSPPMNMISGVLEPERGVVRVAGAAIAAPDSVRERFSARDAVTVEVGVRPEHFRIVEGVSASGVGGTPAWLDTFGVEVGAVEHLGHELLIHAIAQGGVPLVARIPLSGSKSSANRARSVPAPGSRLFLAADSGDVHLFDPASKERLT